MPERDRSRSSSLSAALWFCAPFSYMLFLALVISVASLVTGKVAFAQIPLSCHETTWRTKVDSFAATPNDKSVYGVYLSSPTPADVRFVSSIDAVSDGRFNPGSGFPEKCVIPSFRPSDNQIAKVDALRFPGYLSRTVDPDSENPIWRFTEQTATYPAVTLMQLTPAYCPVPYNPEVMAVRAKPPDYPDAARREGASGRTLVLLNIDSDGTVASATIKSSSGNALLDKATLDAARASTYSPMRFRCKGMGGQYILHASFSAQ
jgi:TonB family protein